jgi:L-iditol 2-dehydrogenase
MLAAILRDIGNLVLEEVPKPMPGPTDAVIKVRVTGICGTDHKAVRGRRHNVKFPIILGHENSGIVDSVGSAVKNFAPGDEVVIAPIGGCGACKWCRLGKVHFCEQGYTTGGEGAPTVLPGGFAEYMLAPEALLYRKPAAVSFEAAALTEPVSCAWKAVVEYSGVRIGEDVVVIGTGGIGIFCAMLARRAGAARVVAVDTSDYALETALRLGATHAVNASSREVESESEVRDEILEILPGGPDFIIEAAGAPDAVKLMFALRRKGTRVNVFGTTTPTDLTIDAGSLNNLETRVDASFSTTPYAMENALLLIERGVIDPREAISHRFPLKHVHKAFDVMDQPDRSKVMIVQE